MNRGFVQIARWIIMCAFLVANPFGFAAWVINLCWVCIGLDLSIVILILLFQ